MNMKSNLLIGASVGLLALALAPVAVANDIKAHHGSECKVYGTTAWTDLGFGWQGIFNNTNVAKVIVCPLVKDSEDNWDGDQVSPLNGGWVDFHFKAGNVATAITCTVYTSRQSNLTSSKTVTVPLSVGMESNDEIHGLVSNGSPNDVASILICSLGAKTVLQHYRLTEPGVTQN